MYNTGNDPTRAIHARQLLASVKFVAIGKSLKQNVNRGNGHEERRRQEQRTEFPGVPLQRVLPTSGYLELLVLNHRQAEGDVRLALPKSFVPHTLMRNQNVRADRTAVLSQSGREDGTEQDVRATLYRTEC